MENVFCFRKTKRGADAIVNVENTVTDLEIKPSNSDMKSERLASKMRDDRESLARYVEAVKEKTARTDGAKSRN